jgi:hypothetical protein
MSIPSLAAVGSRIGQIQGEIHHRTPAPRTFADTLASAQQPTETVAAVLASPHAVAVPAAVPIGILGTPIVLELGIGSPGNDGAWVTQLPSAGQAWATEIDRAATNAGLDPRLLAAVVWQESGFRPDAVSPSGAIGLAQLMPGTADGLEVDPWDPVQNLDGGARYLAWTIREFGSVQLGLAAYNAGPGRVRAAGGIPNIAETQAYVPRVLDYYRQLGGVL